ncbi:MAG: hypothetical protein E7525_04760 [Ruminococcaceae bacterium]|nr:hypothetical protein [Oscillospiraceae bacterium]
MFLNAVKKYFFILPVAMAIMLFATRVWEAQFLITPLPMLGFFYYIECVTPVIMLVPLAFLLYDNFEIELGLVCGVKTSTLMLTKFFSVFIYVLSTVYTMIFFYTYKEFVPNSRHRIVFPIYVPENYKLYMFVSVTVTLSFFAALFLFIRVLTRNCYVPVAVGLAAFIATSTLNSGIHGGTTDMRSALFDPFISVYFVGNTVPNSMNIESMTNIWTNNRLLFAGAAVVLFVCSYLLLRREKLHEGFGE